MPSVFKAMKGIFAANMSLTCLDEDRCRLREDREVTEDYWHCRLHMQNSCKITTRCIWNYLPLRPRTFMQLLLMRVRGLGCNFLVYILTKTFHIITQCVERKNKRETGKREHAGAKICPFALCKP